LQLKVTLEDVKVDPGGGLSITAGPVADGVGVGVGVGGVGVGVGLPEPIVNIPLPVALWPSGLLIVTFCAPGDADVVLRLRVTWVGSTYVTELTVTPPVTRAEMRFAKPTPGSKNPDPATDVPVIVTVAELWPAATLELAEEGVAGGGATSFATSTPYVPIPAQNSCIVHIVMSSPGSTLVNE